MTVCLDGLCSHTNRRRIFHLSLNFISDLSILSTDYTTALCLYFSQSLAILFSQSLVSIYSVYSVLPQFLPNTSTMPNKINDSNSTLASNGSSDDQVVVIQGMLC